MTDIVERLRQPATQNDANRQRDEAANEIVRLRAVNHSNVDFAEQAKQHLNDTRNLIATLRAELREAGLLR